MYEDLSLYIDGEFVKGGGRKEQDVYDPATGDVIGLLPHATKEDLDRALAAAERAFEKWRTSSPMERSKVLRRVGELTRERAKQIVWKEGDGYIERLSKYMPAVVLAAFLPLVGLTGSSSKPLAAISKDDAWLIQ